MFELFFTATTTFHPVGPLLLSTAFDGSPPAKIHYFYDNFRVGNFNGIHIYRVCLVLVNFNR